MEILQLVNAICDALENVTQSVRTRKTKENAPKQSDVFKYPNDVKDRWYKLEQITATHRLDCDSLREAPNALELIVGGVVSTAVIDDQKIGRSLSVEAFAKKYNAVDGVEIDLKSALSKKVKEVDPEKISKLTKQLPRDKQIELANKQMLELGLEIGPDGTLVPKTE